MPVSLERAATRDSICAVSRRGKLRGSRIADLDDRESWLRHQMHGFDKVNPSGKMMCGQAIFVLPGLELDG
jgi:hypothetical protein